MLRSAMRRGRTPQTPQQVNNPGADAGRQPSVLDCYYFALVTATTVGYGDFQPVGLAIWQTKMQSGN